MKRKIVLLSAGIIAIICVFAAVALLRHEDSDESAADYMQAYRELTECVEQLSTSLQKCLHTSSTQRRQQEAATAAYKSAEARVSLSQLQLAEHDALLKSAGEYAHGLTQRLASGEDLSEADIDSLKNLCQAVETLSQNLSSLNSEAGAMNENALAAKLRRIEPASAAIAPAHVAAVGEPKLLAGMGEISKTDASAAASGFLRLRRSTIKYESSYQHGSGVPVYVFSASVPGGVAEIEVTKTGGFVSSVSSTRQALTRGLPVQDAVAAAEKLLQDNGYSNMRVVGYDTHGNEVIVSFAHLKNGITYYPEEITATIGRDTGALIAFDSYC